MSKEEEYRIEIDPFQLDREWVDQPVMYHRAAVQLAEAKRQLDHAKTAMELTKADLYAAISANPEQFGLSKTTETAISQAMVCQKLYQEGQGAIRKAKYQVDVLEAAVLALDQRKKALENLVQLHLSDYYAAPRHKSDSVEQRESVHEMRKAAVRGRARRRAREDN